MLTAAEARKQTEVNYQRKLANEWTEIEKRISDAVAKCNTSITVYSLRAETERQLKDLGYSVDFNTYHNETEYTISW